MSEQPCQIQIGSHVMKGVIDWEPTCPHPTLNMYQRFDERTYWCSACHKKIIIPMAQFATVENSTEAQKNFAGMIELAFGESWGQMAREGRV